MDPAKSVQVRPHNTSDNATRNDLNKAANELSNQSDKLNSELENLLNIKRTIENQITELRNKDTLTEKDKETLVSLENQLASIKTQEEGLRKEIARIDGEITEIKTRIDDLEAAASDQNSGGDEKQLSSAENLSTEEQSTTQVSSISFINFCNNNFTGVLQEAEINDLKVTMQALKGLYQLTDCQMLFNKMNSVTTINLDYKKIRSLRPFAEFSNIKTMSFVGNEINDISGLFNMVALEKLILDSNRISYISSIPSEAFPNLKVLSIKNNALNSIQGIEGLKLTDLLVSGNNISSLVPIQNMLTLVNLDIASNVIKSFAPLENLPNLKTFLPGTNLVGTEEFPWSDHCPIKNGTIYKDWSANVSAVVSDYCVSKVNL